MSGDYVIQVAKGKAGWSALAPELKVLSASAEVLNPFFSSEWLESWSNQVGLAYNPVLMTVRESSGTLAGFWPFVETPAILGRGLWPMGYHGSDYLDPVALVEDPVLRVSLVEGLRTLLKEYKFIWLPLLRKSFAQDFLRPFFARCRQPMLFAPGATRHYVEFGGCSLDALLEDALGSKSRKTLRYTRRKLEEKGRLDFRTYQSETEVSEFLPEFERVEDASWKASEGQGLFHHLGMREFYAELLPKWAKQGGLQINALFLDGKAIACELAFQNGKDYCLHNTSYVPEFSEFSPGRHLLLDSLQKSLDSGMSRFDFMQGNQEYKQKIGTHSEPVYTVSLFQKSGSGRLNKWIIGGIQKRRAAAKASSKE